MLESVFSVTKADGKKASTGSVYAPINCIGLCAWQYISCEVGNTLISGENVNDVYKFYLESLLGNTTSSKETWFSEMVIWEGETRSKLGGYTLTNKT